MQSRQVKVLQMAEYVQLKHKLFRLANQLAMVKRTLSETQEQLSMARIQKINLLDELNRLKEFINSEVSDTVYFHPEGSAPS